MEWVERGIVLNDYTRRNETLLYPVSIFIIMGDFAYRWIAMGPL
jgi:hypothetical protein